MKVLQNLYIRNNIITIMQALVISACVITLLQLFSFLQIIIIALVASIGLQCWRELNPWYADYITSAEAPFASLSLLIIVVISHSMTLSIIVTFLVLFIYHYFFSSYELYHDIYFTALLFSIILFFITMYLHTMGIFDDYTTNIFTGFHSNTSSIVTISICMCIAYMYLSKLKYEFKIIGLGNNYISLLGFDEHLIHIMLSIARTLIVTMIFMLIGWLGSLLTTIPRLRRSNQTQSIIIFTVIISMLLYAKSYTNPFYIIIPVVTIDFLYVFFLARGYHAHVK
ncbi:MAG: hypothetical protein ACUVRK_04850 [Spirochaetota bacterium]